VIITSTPGANVITLKINFPKMAKIGKSGKILQTGNNWHKLAKMAGGK
jgi:hypothetical protein